MTWCRSWVGVLGGKDADALEWGLRGITQRDYRGSRKVIVMKANQRVLEKTRKLLMALHVCNDPFAKIQRLTTDRLLPPEYFPGLEQRPWLQPTLVNESARSRSFG